MVDSLPVELFTLICRETGLDCDYVIEGETEEEILSTGADHAIKVHGLKAEYIFLEYTSYNFLCQTLSKLSNNRWHIPKNERWLMAIRRKLYGFNFHLSEQKSKYEVMQP